jgi:hypothetical protein
MTLKELAEDLKKYVTLDRYGPVEKLVYGFTGIILTGVVVALVALVIKK